MQLLLLSFFVCKTLALVYQGKFLGMFKSFLKAKDIYYLLNCFKEPMVSYSEKHFTVREQ